MGIYMDFEIDQDPMDEVPDAYTTIEVVLDDISVDSLWIRLSEDAQVFTVPNKHIKIIDLRLPYATLRMKTEKAILYNLL